MTVVAANLKEMAADSLTTYANNKYHTTKIYRLDDGSVAGVAGTGGEHIVAWLQRGGRKGDEPPMTERMDFTVLHLRHDGLYLYVNDTIADKLKDKSYAIGSGGKVAQYVMKKYKASPMEACEAATQVDPYCGGPIDVLKLRR